MHQTFKKSSLAMTYKLDDMIELPKSQSKKKYKEELECEIVMVKVTKCMSWLDACDEPIGDLDMMEDKVDNPSPQSTPQVLPSFELSQVKVQMESYVSIPSLRMCTYGLCRLFWSIDIGRKAHLLEDKQIPSVGVFDEFLALYGVLERKYHDDFGTFLEEDTDKTTTLQTVYNLERNCAYSSVQIEKAASRSHPSDGVI
ncbi:hypothetical protein Tco_0405107 [Tanacetum coccineum]